MTGSIPPPNPLAYTGQVVVPFIQRPFMPETTFNQFPVPTIWIDNVHQNAYILVAKPLGVADWILIGGTPGTIATITTPSGTVTPIASDIVFMDGTGITITSGSPAENVITFSTSGDVPVSFTTNSGTATPALGVLSIVGGTGILTSATGDVITINLVIPVTVADGGTGVTSFTPYTVITGGTTSTGPLQSLASTGTALQVLTSQGPGVLPIMAPNQFSFLGYQLIAPGTTSVQFLNLPNQNGTYLFVLRDIRPNTNNVNFLMNLSDDGGATWKNTGFQSSVITTPYNSTTQSVASTTTQIILGSGLLGGAISTTGTYVIYFTEYGSSNSYITGTTTYSGQAAVMQYGRIGAECPISDASVHFNSFQFLFSSGTFGFGQISVYSLYQFSPI